MSFKRARSTRRVVAGGLAGSVALGLVLAGPAGAILPDVAETRISGADRYSTAAQVAIETFGGADVDNIILASGENFPDGLAAAGLAGAVGAPVLLTAAASLPDVTRLTIDSLDTDNTLTVHVVGGTAAVSQAVADAVDAINAAFVINRIGGTTRYDTAQLIAQAAFAANGNAIGTADLGNGVLATAIVATGTNFPDALAAGSLAYSGVHPIVLTDPTTLSQDAEDALVAIGAQQVIIMGGTAAISTAVETALQTNLGLQTVRVAGANRNDTAARLGNTLIDEGIFDGVDVDLVTGMNFADALAAGPHAGSTDAAIVLATGTTLPAETTTFLNRNADTIATITAIGGTAAVSAAELTAAEVAAETVTATATSSIVESAQTTAASTGDLGTGGAGTLDLLSKATGTAAGVAGNAWDVVVFDSNAAGVSVTVDAALRDLRIGYNIGGAAVDVTAVASAIVADAAANALFTPVVTAAGDFDEPAGSTDLAGGVTTSVVEVRFNEAIDPAAVVAAGFELDVNNDGFADDVADSAAVDANEPTEVDAVFTATGADAGDVPVPGTSRLRLLAGAVEDLAGNPNAAVALLLSAGNTEPLL